MSDAQDDILAKLAAAGDDPVAKTVAMVDFACGDNAALRRAVEVAAIPHWFDVKILEALLDPEDQPNVEELYAQLLELSFVEPYEERNGNNIHEATRRALRKQLARDDRERLVELSIRIRSFLGNAHIQIQSEIKGLGESDSANLQKLQDAAEVILLEFISHHLIADSVQGMKLLFSIFYQLHARGDAQPVLRVALQLDELVEDDLLLEPARATSQYVRGYARLPFGDLKFVEKCAQDAIRGFHSSGVRLYEGANHELLGNVWIERGDLEKAEKAFFAYHKINQLESGLEPGNQVLQRNVSVSWNNLGDVQVARGSLETAEESYGKSLEIRQRLASQDESNSGWQRDLSVSWERLGNVQVARGSLEKAQESYGKSLEIRQRLASQDESNSGWQRDLSVSWNNLGDLSLKQGDASKSESYHRKALAIDERLTKLDPSNHNSLVGESASAERVGEALVAMNQFGAAEPYFGRSLEIAERLAAEDPNRFAARTWVNLADTLGKVANFNAKRDETELARAQYHRALDILTELRDENRLAHKQLKQIEEFEAALGKL